ncbi:MAG: DUF2007 domain-containing protein [Balneolales bacterium]|nr:DUF2007 domain-containing protein [Balneolales bacterium]
MFGNNPKPPAVKEWTCIFQTGHSFEAEMMKNFLTDRDIPAQILSKKDSAYVVNHSQLSLIYVYVPDRDVEAAQAAIKEFESGELIKEDFPDDDES